MLMRSRWTKYVYNHFSVAGRPERLSSCARSAHPLAVFLRAIDLHLKDHLQLHSHLFISGVKYISCIFNSANNSIKLCEVNSLLQDSRGLLHLISTNRKWFNSVSYCTRGNWVMWMGGRRDLDLRSAQTKAAITINHAWSMDGTIVVGGYFWSFPIVG